MFVAKNKYHFKCYSCIWVIFLPFSTIIIVKVRDAHLLMKYINVELNFRGEKLVHLYWTFQFLGMGSLFVLRVGNKRGLCSMLLWQVLDFYIWHNLYISQFKMFKDVVWIVKPFVHKYKILNKNMSLVNNPIIK